MGNVPQFRMGPIPNPTGVPHGVHVFMDDVRLPGMGFRMPFGMQGT